MALLSSLLGGCALSHGLEDDRLPFDSGPRDSGLDSGPVDAGPVDAGPVDAGPDADVPPDSGFPDGGLPGCESQDAREDLCSDVHCEALDEWYWDGASCYPAACGTCVGEDCGAGFASQEVCEELHATCIAQLCTDTGGEWRWWDEVCGHYSCGFEPPADCLIGGPACDCGPDGTFDEDFGCVLADCPDVDVNQEMLCINTGGSWDNICCATTCGESCPDPCGAPACACGADEVFHPLRGCERGVECMERNAGQSCTPAARCELGSVCCDTCSGVGCEGAPTCRMPLCAPNVDLCGNYPDAP